MPKDTVTFFVTITDEGGKEVHLEVIGRSATVECDGLVIRNVGVVLAIPLPYFSRLDIPS